MAMDNAGADAALRQEAERLVSRRQSRACRRAPRLAGRGFGLIVALRMIRGRIV